MAEVKGGTFTDYKQIIMLKLIEDTQLLKALVNNNSDFLETDIPIEPEETAYNYIFPYRNTKNILTETKNFLTMEFKDFRPSEGNYYKSGKIIFYVIVHANLVKSDYGNRQDFIYDRVKSIFDNSRFIGIGKTVVGTVSDLDINEDYYGCTFSIQITDFK